MGKQITINSNIVIPEVKIIDCFAAEDQRGTFIKVFNENIYNELGIKTNIREIFYSISKKDVIRGLHYQDNPCAQEKIVYVISGSIKDIIVDIRKDSKNFGKVAEIELSANDTKAIYIPQGFAHGFRVLEDNTIMVYNVSEGYNKECDKGVLWSSIEYDWDVSNPILSERDKSFISIYDLK